MSSLSYRLFTFYIVPGYILGLFATIAYWHLFGVERIKGVLTLFVLSLPGPFRILCLTEKSLEHVNASLIGYSFIASYLILTAVSWRFRKYIFFRIILGLLSFCWSPVGALLLTICTLENIPS